MNNVQFDALYALSHSWAKRHDEKEALRLVFVEGLDMREAARRKKLAFRHVEAGCMRIQKVIRLAYAAVTGIDPTTSQA